MDLIIRGGIIVDGLGNPPFQADIAIRNGLIESIGHNITNVAKLIIDATGLMICPGFIDVHSHDDMAIIYDSRMEPKVSQGVTTTIMGNCGLGIFPLSSREEDRKALQTYVEPVLGKWNGSFGFLNSREYADALSQTQIGINAAFLVAHGALRIAVKGFSDSEATPNEINQMMSLLTESMNHGAIGMSLGLMYSPGCFATKAELVALCKVVGQLGGIVTAHIRGEGDLLLASIQEMIDLAEEADVPFQISHLKAVGRRNWGSVRQALELLDETRSRGVNITCDVYPYSAGSTTLLSLMPPWVLEGGVEAGLSRIFDPVVSNRIIEELGKFSDQWDNVGLLTGFDRITLSETSEDSAKQYESMSLQDIANKMGYFNVIEGYVKLVELCKGMGTIVVHHMDEDDVQEVLAYPHSMVGSDGLPTTGERPHPRLYGTFPRIISEYVRNRGIFSLAEGVRKMTSQSAIRFQLRNRGAIAKGYHADLVIFDSVLIEDKATYERPRTQASGIIYTIVNGHVVMDHGVHTGMLVGEVVLKTI